MALRFLSVTLAERAVGIPVHIFVQQTTGLQHGKVGDGYHVKGHPQSLELGQANQCNKVRRHEPIAGSQHEAAQRVRQAADQLDTEGQARPALIKVHTR